MTRTPIANLLVFLACVLLRSDVPPCPAPQDVAYATAEGVVVNARTGCFVEIEPAILCRRLHCRILASSPLSGSRELPCSGLIMSPADVVEWDGLPCNSPSDRPGCATCSCEQYHQRFYVAAFDRLVVPGARSIIVEFALPLTYPPEAGLPSSLDSGLGWTLYQPSYESASVTIRSGGRADFNLDGDLGTDEDIEAFFRCLAESLASADFDGDGDVGTDSDIMAFFRALSGG